MNKNGEVKCGSLAAGVDCLTDMTANSGADDIGDRKWREVMLFKIDVFSSGC